MRKLFFSLVGILAAVHVFAQNVGIGTTTPAVKLDVKSTTNTPAQFNGTAPMYIALYESDVYKGYLGSYSGGADDIDIGTGAGNVSGKLNFTIQAVPKMTINASGQVGIGTSSPAHQLHVTGGDYFFESSVGKIMFGYNSGGSQWRLGTTGAGADIRWYTYNGTTETAMHYFQQNGNVGIATGIPVPQGRLDVLGAGTTSATSTFLLRNSNTDTLLRMRDDGRMGIGYNGSSYGRTVNIGGSGINFYLANEAAFGGAIFPTDTSIVMWSNSNSNNYVILQPSWGNVGVGTYTPNSKFHVNGVMLIGSNSAFPATGYSLSVDGKIISEELKVQLSTSWPDYVFGEDYKLLPIEDLEKSIRQNKHLPNIPSAADITAEKGFEVGDMNRRLLEKVEELTLYIIELNKRIKLLEEKEKK